jgi:hypothetical protein
VVVPRSGFGSSVLDHGSFGGACRLVLVVPVEGCGVLGCESCDRLLARDVVRHVDDSHGCSIKDSFASIELSAEGFRPLFEAEWIHRAGPAPRLLHGLRNLTNMAP